MSRDAAPDTGRRPSRGPGPVILTVMGFAILLPVLAGFVLHTSPSDSGSRVFGKYSLPYSVFLLLLLVLTAAVPLLARALARPTRMTRPDGTTVVVGGWRKVRFVVGAIVVCLVATGLGAETVVGTVRTLTRPGDGEAPGACEVFFDEWSARSREQNTYGWLGPEVTTSKPAGTYRIMALGGSTTFLENLIDNPEETNFTSRLGVSLQAARPAWRVEVVNAAANAHTSMQSLIKYVTFVRDLDPDLVMIMDGLNEAQEGALEEHVLEWKRPYERDYMDDARALGRWGAQGGLGRPRGSVWDEALIVGQARRRLRATFLSDLRRRAPLTRLERRRLAELETLQPIDAFRRNYRALSQLLKARGSRLVVFSQPTMFRPGGIEGGVGYLTPEDADAWRFHGDRERIYDEAWVRTLRRLNDAARETARDQGAVFVDLESAVPPKWEHFHFETSDGVHMSEKGCELAAGALHEAILPLIPERPAAPQD